MITVTFTAYKNAKTGECYPEWSEQHTSAENAKLRASALNWIIVKVEG